MGRKLGHANRCEIISPFWGGWSMPPVPKTAPSHVRHPGGASQPGRCPKCQGFSEGGGWSRLELFFSETGGIIGMRPTVHHRKAMPATLVFVSVETAAAEKIQRFWRWCRLFATNRVLAKRFERLSLRAHDMEAMRCCFAIIIIIIMLFCAWSKPLTRPCLVASSERLSTSDSRRWWIALACSSSA